MTPGKPNKKKNLITDAEGATGVLFALLAVPMFALMGIAVEYSRTLNSRESMQLALDAAVLAGRNAPADEQVAVAQSYFKANLRKVIGHAQATFTRTSDGNLAGSAIVDIKTPIAGLVKSQKVTVEVTALAKPNTTVIEDVMASSGSPCIHVLDQSGAKTFWLDSNSNMDAHNCEVRVRSNHNAQAMYEVSSSKVKFKKIMVKGYASIGSAYGADKLYIADAPNKVTENAQVVGNPFLSAITEVARNVTSGACTAANTNKTFTGAVKPGTYCGTTEFKNATFATGVYVIASSSGNKNGNLKLSGSLDGSAGVTFYLADNKSSILSYNASEGSVLKAPTTGATKGILFFEASNRGNAYNLTIASCNKQSWTGLFYMPSLNLTLDSLSEWPVFNVAMTINQLKLKSLSTVVSPYAWTPDGYTSPITISDDVQKTSDKDGWLMR